MKNQALQMAQLSKGMNNFELADRAGISHITVSKARNGQPVSRETMAALCRALNYEPELLGFPRDVMRRKPVRKAVAK